MNAEIENEINSFLIIMSTIRTQKAKENLDFLTGLPSRNKGEILLTNVIQKADKALYFVKQNGKSDFSFHEK